MIDDNDVPSASGRGEAFADDPLVDVTEMAQAAGYCVPVVVTWAVWCRHVRSAQGAGQDEQGCLWAFLTACRNALTKSWVERRRLSFAAPVRGSSRGTVSCYVTAEFGPGEDGRSRLTIMLPHET